MSVQSEIDRIKGNIADAYAKIAEKGGSVPSQPSSANLAAAVESIPASSGPSGTSKWEVIKTITLDKDISRYEIASLGDYNEILVVISRPAYVQGLNKNVWFKVQRVESAAAYDWYTAGYLTTQFGYVALNVALHVNDVFVYSDVVCTNNLNAQTAAQKNVIGTYSSENTRENSVFAMVFTDASVIQGDETVVAYGVPR